MQDQVSFLNLHRSLDQHLCSMLCVEEILKLWSYCWNTEQIPLRRTIWEGTCCRTLYHICFFFSESYMLSCAVASNFTKLNFPISGTARPFQPSRVRFNEFRERGIVFKRRATTKEHQNHLQSLTLNQERNLTSRLRHLLGRHQKALHFSADFPQLLL